MNKYLPPVKSVARVQWDRFFNAGSVRGEVVKCSRFVMNSRVWRSIFRVTWPRNQFERAQMVFTNFVLHLHPVKVNRRAVRFSYTFCLGGVSLLLAIVLTVTGALLMFYYVPSTDRAYSDIIALKTDVPFGNLVRNMHRWAAHGMVLSVFLHMLRVFYTGAYKRPREFNWVLGISLIVLTLVLSFTGYLLPWDQLSYWAITVGTNMAGYAPWVGSEVRRILLGGTEVGQGALLRFYVLHVAVLPLIAFVIMAVHFWRVRKDGFSGNL